MAVNIEVLASLMKMREGERKNIDGERGKKGHFKIKHEGSSQDMLLYL